MAHVASGSAIPAIWSPNIDTVDALQYLRNTRFRSRAGIIAALRT